MSHNKIRANQRLRWLVILGCLIGGWLVLIGPWPVDYTPLVELAEFQTTRQQISQQLSLPQPIANLEVGFASWTLALPTNLPLAGYGKRRGATATGQLDPIRVKATAFRLGDKTVLLLGGDLLFITRPLAAQLEQSVKQDHQAELFLVATHTHSGPGGWGKNAVERLVTGAESPPFLAQLRTALQTVAAQALTKLQPAKLGLATVQAPNYVKNRLLTTTANAPVDARLQWAQFVALADGRPLGTWISYGAHATTLNAENLQFSADYPGVLERSLEAKWHSPVFFCAGPVGSQAPRHPPGKGHILGKSLAKLVVETKLEWFEPPYHFRIARLPLHIPPLQYRLSDNVRLAPWLANHLLEMGPNSYLNVLRIGPWVALGLPTELSGEIALQLYPIAKKRGLRLWLTPFNGDYLGYVVPDKYYGLNRYETRVVNTLGPHGGTYMKSILNQVLEAL